VFVIDVPPAMGEVIDSFLNQRRNVRPQAHDLMLNMFAGFNINVDRAVITDLKNSTYYAHLILNMDNEVSHKFVEMDGRPSDCLALALAQDRPIFVTASLFAKVQDMSEYLERFTADVAVPRWA
jgi:bifunctional DNase/RNase